MTRERDPLEEGLKTPSTPYVTQYRERARLKGQRTIYANVSADAVAALEAIRTKRICTTREAVEAALRLYARELTRKR